MAHSNLAFYYFFFLKAPHTISVEKVFCVCVLVLLQIMGFLFFFFIIIKRNVQKLMMIITLMISIYVVFDNLARITRDILYEE